MPRRHALALLIPLLLVLGALAPVATAAASDMPKPQPFVVTAKLTPATIATGGTARVTGVVRPGSAGDKRVVDLQVQQSGGSWKTVSTARSTGRATYQLVWKPTAAGVFKLRVVAPKAGSHKTGTSDVLKLTVVAKTSPIVEQVSISGQGTYAHGCVVLTNRSVWCWGDNQVGELGDGTLTSSLTAVQVKGISTADEIATGTYASCARLTTGHVDCWGYATNGQMGNGSRTGNTLGGVCGSTASACDAIPVEVKGITDAVSISVGQQFACAVLAGGGVRCWGYDEDGELGDGFSEAGDGAATNSGDIQPAPVNVTGITTATSVSSGYETSCVTLGDGTLRCWGLGIAGGLGDGKTTYVEPDCSGRCSDTAVRVIGEASSRAVTYGGVMGCSLQPDRTVDCWGDNSSGNLGLSDTYGSGPEHCQTANEGYTTDCSSTVVEVTGLTGVAEVSSDTYGACALLSSGSVKCWGADSDGEVGNGTTASSVRTPALVSNLDDATDVAGGDRDACATTEDGSVLCWGNNEYGQLGNGTTTDSSVPTEVKGLP